MMGIIVLMYPRAKPLARFAAELDLELSTSDRTGKNAGDAKN